MSTLKNDTFLRALLREPVDYTPIWIMRQAGRYLPEYRATRAQAGDFMSLCKNKDLACEVTLQPLERFDLDAAILFSDILTIPDAMGLGLYFEAGEGPKFKKVIESQADVDALFIPKMDDELKYVMDAVNTIRTELNGRIPLIGFSGSPWTLATYMIEGGSSKDYRKIKGMMYASPERLHQVLDVLARSVTAYLNAQIKAGAQAVQVFDSWGGVLSPAMYREFSLKYMQQIVEGLIREHDGRKVPVILFTKGGGAWATDIAATGTDAMGVDWTTDLSTVKAVVGDNIALQGNLDPSVLYGTPEVIRHEVKAVLDSYGDDPTGHVFNLGHGVHQFVDPENVKALVDSVHELSVR